MSGEPGCGLWLRLQAREPLTRRANIFSRLFATPLFSSVEVVESAVGLDVNCWCGSASGLQPRAEIEEQGKTRHLAAAACATRRAPIFASPLLTLPQLFDASAKRFQRLE